MNARQLLCRSGMALVAAAFVVAPRADQCLRAEDIRDSLQIIAEAYAANQSAFATGRCRFTYSIRSAGTEEQALKSEWSDDEKPCTIDFAMFFHDDQMTLKTAIDNDEIVRRLQASDGQITPINVARKKGYAIDHDAIVNTAIVHAPANFQLNVRYQPFNLAMDSQRTDPASSIAFAEANDFAGIRFTIKKDVRRDEGVYLLLTKESAADSHDMHAFIDPRRGYLPFITEYLQKNSGRLFSRMRILDVHQEGEAWFPMHAMSIIPRVKDSGESYVQVREMKVLELEIGYRPTEEDLTIKLPKHTQYSDGVNPNTAKSLFRDQPNDFAPISVDDIEGIYNELQELAREREADEAALSDRHEVQSERTSFRGTLLLAVNAAALAVAGILFVRTRRRTQRS